MPKGSVLVVGGGISGVQAALDLANSGFLVHLVERTTAIGGKMSQLDKTFPTNDCSACILSPKLVECGRHLNINLLTLSDLVSLEGEPGNFKAVVRQRPRYVDPTKCIACGLCAEKCPKKVTNDFNMGIGKRKAAYLSYPQAVPLKYALDPAHCIWINKPGRCGVCAKECPAGAINFDDTARDHVLEVGSVVLAPGFSRFNPTPLDFTGYGRLPNVVTTMEFERFLSPSGPCMGHLERPSDGKEPKKIAWLQCVGSRDINRAGHPYCSSICCMFALKQAVIAKEHSHGDFEPSIFYMDMRTHGKGFENYYTRAREEGVHFHRARVHSIIPSPDNQGNLKIRYVNEQGKVNFEEFDMVVLSTGLEPYRHTIELASMLGLELDADNFVRTDSFNPVATSRPGIYVCGAASEPKDIPQSVVEASAAAAEASRILAPVRWTETSKKVYPAEQNIYAQAPRIGVFVCHCGINIASVVDVAAVSAYAGTLPDVVFSQANLFTCSQDTINQMISIIKEQDLNRVVVASCSPRTHEPLFQETLRDAGLNKFLFEMANIRDQDSWVHQREPEKATTKAKDLVRMAVARVRGEGALPYNTVAVTKAALVIGGGVSGMTSALAFAEQGYPVTLIEQSDMLGGNGRKVFRNWKGVEFLPFINDLTARVASHPHITVKYNTEIKEASGSVGKFSTTFSDGRTFEHGVTVMAVGGEPYKPEGQWRFLHGVNPNVHTLLELDKKFIDDDPTLKNIKQAVFIHCVGSRIAERPYCSRVCCTHAIDSAVKLKEMNPDMDVFMLYRDVRTYGQRERIYQEARAKGVVFIRYDLERLPQVSEKEGRLIIKCHDPIIDAHVVIQPDMLVLATAIQPRRQSSTSLAKFFKCAIDSQGFLMEAHMKLRPVDFATEGVFLAGLCHYPKSMEESIAQAKAAAARASIILAHDAVPAESVTAVVTAAKCTGCGLCTEVCAYNAVSLDDNGISVVNTSMCKGCGACVAGCRSDAVTLKNIGNEQIMATVDAAFE
ncbi:MAG: CoB--CoM heterodisulfide reductase iron-sulfur subunit A family protein [Deltaproteobacteria bacterium]|nr:CoB--CoM heterodisulfide reductase iron-sulfur subunit A family protein [Deltaproteobacteria bacterium]